MVRGCQKKMVYLKSTGSDVFEEAYFVVRDGALAGVDECDMVKEANKILSECVSLEEKCSARQKIKGFIKKWITPFLGGMTVGIIIAILIK